MKSPSTGRRLDSATAPRRSSMPRDTGIAVSRRSAGAALLASFVLSAIPRPLHATKGESRILSPPQKAGGMALMDALARRRSTREFSERTLPAQLLSDLLWAAYGINRPSGDRTAPYWRHIMVIDVYAAMADGVWLYDPRLHALQPHLAEDLRAQTGLQDFVASAPLNLVYVAHGERMRDISPTERRLYASVDTGFIGQNVYLFCASAGLATVFRGAVDLVKLGKAMRLDEESFVTFAQTVGYPKG